MVPDQVTGLRRRKPRGCDRQTAWTRPLAPAAAGGLSVGTIDETSQVKQGERTVGVKRHYLGCAGKVANGITTVHLAYARERTGHALIEARQKCRSRASTSKTP